MDVILATRTGLLAEFAGPDQEWGLQFSVGGLTRSGIPYALGLDQVSVFPPTSAQDSRLSEGQTLRFYVCTLLS